MTGSYKSYKNCELYFYNRFDSAAWVSNSDLRRYLEIATINHRAEAPVTPNKLYQPLLRIYNHHPRHDHNNIKSQIKNPELTKTNPSRFQKKVLLAEYLQSAFLHIINSLQKTSEHLRLKLV